MIYSKKQINYQEFYHHFDNQAEAVLGLCEVDSPFFHIEWFWEFEMVSTNKLEVPFLFAV